MPHFSEQSITRLKSCDWRLQMVCLEAIQYTDFSILYGHRTQVEQMEAYMNGRSKVRWPESRHNTIPSRAVDVAPYPIDWHDLRRFDVLAGRLLQIGARLGIGLRWGGDWDGDQDVRDQQFNDLGHFELISG
jgi:peptidoglycan L-alanyl-D-glutamate endopeptidase CwlK